MNNWNIKALCLTRGTMVYLWGPLLHFHMSLLYPKICPRIFPQEISAPGISWFFKLAQESDKRTFLVSQTKIRVLLIFRAPECFTQVGLGFWLILAQFWSGECSLAFNQELRFLWAYSQKDLNSTALCKLFQDSGWIRFVLI